jgi:hypothetical protein
MNDPDRKDRLPLPSEDTGDLANEPARGDTDDYRVAREEGVPYTPPTERVVSETRLAESGPDGASQDIGAVALEALRQSELPAGDRVQVGAIGSTVYLRGELESVEIADEMVAGRRPLSGRLR